MQPKALARVLALGCTLVSAGCPGDDDATRIDEACLTEGRCECLRSSDCDAGLTCVDGACRDLRPDVRPDAAPDTADTTTTTAPTDARDDVGPEPGRLGWPCDDDEQCNSGRCIPYGDGRVCTESCVETCPAGWGCKGLASALSVDFYCVPADERLCEPCLGDRSCLGRDGTTNLCVALADGPVCAVGCGPADACPVGYTCRDATSVDGLAARQCLPEGGACQCGPDATGIEIPCQVDNALGTCFGTRPCLAGGAIGACSAPTPAAEACNAQDDDCNGFTDDVLVTPCQRDNDFGVCPGELRCLPGAGAVCTAAEPAAELCNNLDDDCDGATDEDFVNELDQIATLEHCGACGASCLGRFANADETRCDDAGATPACVVVRCAPGFILDAGGSCVRPIDRLCEPCTGDASCGGADDRCVVDPIDGRGFCARDCGPDNLYGGDCPSGYACEDVGGGDPQCVPATGSCDCSAQNAGQIRPCSTTTAAGTCFGIATCDAERGWSDCSARVAAAEVCDGDDDDCDGVADDGLGGTQCTRDNDFGSCPGVQVCDGAAGRLVCVARDAAPEVCNGLDDDCDRAVDEEFAVVVRDEDGQPVGLKYTLSDAHCGACGFACAAAPPATDVACDGTGLEPFCRILACAPGYWVDPSGRVCLPVPSANLCLPCEGDADCQGPNDLCLGGDYGGRCGRDCGPGNIYGGGCPDGFGCVDGQCRRDSGDCACDADGKLRPCAVTTAAGTCVGVETCTASGPGAGWSACSAATPAPEVCNGEDDDCDGLVDQADPDVDVTGLAGYPACENVSAACGGRWTCGDDGAGFSWTCSAREPEGEICNGRDDDCDGLVDDGFVDGAGAYRLIAHCGQCGLDCRGAIANLGAGDDAVACQDVAGEPTCVPVRCAAGFVPFPVDAPRVCLPLDATSCRPCQVDGDCGLGGDQCVAIGRDDGSYCAQRCDAAAPYPGCTGAPGERGCCPGGFTCGLVDGAALCQPDSGSCQCDADAAGARRVCQATGNGGMTTCFGTETCALAGAAYGWSACDLSANVEVCDALDNDCDGATDEGFQTGGVYASEAHCGECGRSCALAFDAATQHASGACELGSPPRCGLGACLPDALYDWVDLDGAEGNGCECPVLRGGPADAPDVLAQVPTVGAPMLDSDCDGIDGDRESAVFVRAGATAGDGSYAAPYGTIQAAIDAFAPGDSAILVATGVYAEAIVLRSGVSLFGGYSADFTRRDIVLFPTVIAPDVADLGGARVGAVNASGVDQPTTFAGFTVRGVDPTTRGASTYAVYIRDSTAALVLTNDTIVGGRAAPGDLGDDGAPGAGGGHGAAGLHSRECLDAGCSGGTETQVGGAGGANASCAAAAGCLGMESDAGENPQVKDTPAAGCAYNRGGSKGNYNGGAAELCKYDFSPGGNNVGDGGDDGTQGTDGGAGAGCADADGLIVSDLWAPAAGASGGLGTAGTGGMGGSAGGWADNSKASTCTQPAPGANFGDLGASGGGGGAGGCGGTGGNPGAPGGASFAVFVARRGASSPVIEHSLIVRGQGGAGGAGGSGGTGGKGGTGGSGGVALWPAWGAGTAGPGGRGGDGGDGGGGGGGCGGPAYGIAGPGAPTATYLGANAFGLIDAVATGGAGGAGGLSAGAGAGTSGVAGQSANVKAW